MNHLNIIFPIEIISRELDYKLLIASFISKNTGDIIFCHSDLAHEIVKKYRNGIYFGKFLGNPKRIEIYEQAKKNNFSIVHLDEEGAVYPGPLSVLFDNLEIRLDINTFCDDDYVCVWGNLQENFYKSKLDKKSHVNIKNTGHIRFDLYRKPYRGIYQEEAEKLRKKFGPYVLINTHFSYAINKGGLSDPSNMQTYLEDQLSKRRKKAENKEFSSRIAEEAAEEAQKVAHFVSLAKYLSSELKDLNFVFRPHPAEDFDFYKTTLQGIENIFVINEGSVGPWIIGSEALIHDRCTTAIEAYFAEVPVINHKIITNEKYDNRITNQIGIKTTSNLETKEAIEKVLKDRANYCNIQTLEKEQYDILHNFQKDTVSGFTKFFDGVVKNKNIQEETKTVSILQLKIDELIIAIVNFIKYPLRYLFFRQKHIFLLQCKVWFPGFDKSIIQKKLSFLEKLSGKRLNVKLISKRLFILRSD